MWDDAESYDRATGWFADDLPYWASLVEEYRPRRLLELACGTGRIAVPLAAVGLDWEPTFRLVGLDRSPSFLARARERQAALPPEVGSRIAFVEGDMRRFDLGERFDLVILGYNSLAYLLDVDDQLACLSAVRRHLAAGGRFAIDLAVPDYRLLHEAQDPMPVVRQELGRPDPAPGIAQFASACVSRYDPVSQTEFTSHYWQFYRTSGGVDSLVKNLEWHAYFPRELELLMRAAGLNPAVRYGGYDREPFGPSSRQYLWVATAAKCPAVSAS